MLIIAAFILAGLALGLGFNYGLIFGDVSEINSIKIDNVIVTQNNIEVKGSVIDSDMVFKGYKMDIIADAAYIRIREGPPKPFTKSETAEFIINEEIAKSVSKVYLSNTKVSVKEIWDKQNGMIASR